MLLFVHMHKCAGSTVRKSAQKAGLVLPAKHRNGNLLEPGGGAVLYADMPPDKVRSVIRQQRDAGIEFMAMEWDFPPISSLPKRGVDVFTVLRDPYARAASNFRYAKSRGVARADVAFRQFMNNGFKSAGPISRSSNYYVRKLNTLDSTEPVGVEHLKRAIRISNRFKSVIILEQADFAVKLSSLGISDVVNTNVSSQIKSVKLPPDALEISDDDREWYEKNNKLDQKLYEHFKSDPMESTATTGVGA